MEFSHNMQSPAPARAAQSGSPAPVGGKAPKGSWKMGPMWLRVLTLVLLFAATAITVSLLALIAFGGPSESNYIVKGDQQAVFLTNGQVYFGKVTAVNKQYITLQNIYYLNVNQQVQPNQSGSNSSSSNSNQSVSLVKLGCELHGPTDQMVINHEQVTFWENLKDGGQVSKAIAQWAKQNPNGQTCTAASTSNTPAASTTTKP